MTNPLYDSLKGIAYPVLATLASCDHPKAIAQGYADGWQQLMDKHDGNEMALFCLSLPKHLSEAQSVVLLDGLAREYAACSSWQEFVDACVEHPDWKPSKGPAPVARG